MDEGRGFAGGYMQLDVRHLGDEIIKQRLPGIRRVAMDFAGVDPIETPIPVHPDQHYSMGGLACDENGETNVAGLFAIGECSCISVHGASRLGGSSLLETIFFGKRAGDRATEQVSESANRRVDEKALKQALLEEQTAIEALKKCATGERQITIRRRMQETMAEHVGVFRHKAGLREAVEQLADLGERYERVVLDNRGDVFNYDLVDALESGGMLELAEVTALAPLRRTERRGSHWRTDHQGRDDERWIGHSVASCSPDGRPELAYKDVIITKYPPRGSGNTDLAAPVGLIVW